mgnify:CR=1 FL=1
MIRALALLAGLVLFQPLPADTLRHSGFDVAIQRSAARWLPEYDWRWLRAQCYQESRLDPRAVSPAGAKGLCQFMPGTWAEARGALGVRGVFDPDANALAAGWYMRRMLRVWIEDRTAIERLRLAQASYNAGAGNIIRAQGACDGARRWEVIRECLPSITGRHSAETIEYVIRIRDWFAAMVCRGGQ